MSFKPSLDQQRSCPTCTDSLIDGEFTISYDVNRESPANVQVPSYWLHQAVDSQSSGVRAGVGGATVVQCYHPRASAQGPVSCRAWARQAAQSLCGLPWRVETDIFLGCESLLLCARVTNVRLLKGYAPPVSFPFQIVNGYFVHFFAPQGLPVVPKNIVFVIDVSGSMQGRKMEQVLSSVQVGVTDGRGREIFF